MTPHQWLLVAGLSFAFTLPGPCSFDSHPELDCGANEKPCPAGLVCAADGYCKPEDVACDDVGGVPCAGLCCGSAQACCDDVCQDDPAGVGCAGQEGEGEGEGEVCFADVCDGACVDTENDPNHCGECFERCGVGEFCRDRECRTGDDDDCCGRSCIDCGVGRCENQQCADECSMTAQDCGADGTCTFSSPNPPPIGVCVEPFGAVDEYATCVRNLESSDCQPGLDCLAIGTESVCVRYCAVGDDEQCNPDAQHCLSLTPTFGACGPQCNPDDDFVCSEGSLVGTCTPFNGICSGVGAGACAPSGQGEPGTSCSVSSSCLAGTTCHAGACRALCRLQAGNPCPDGGVCTDVFGCAEVGLCVP
jgi:hypothetical protein